MDLEAYLARIRFTGRLEATLDTLRALHLAHAQAIPFENLNPLLGWPVPLDLPAIENKLVHGGRGGYCFEHNALFAAALRELGFEVTGLAARVVWNAPEEAIRPRGHMLLEIPVEGAVYIADVGFGGLGLTAPLRLEPDVEQATPHETFRLQRLTDALAAENPVGHDFRLQALVAGEWKTLYRFDLQPQHALDYELPNYFLSTHPSSHFRSTLMAALPFPGGRLALANNQFTVHRLGQPSDRTVLTSVADVRETLAARFGLTLPEGDELDAALSRACGFGG